MQFVDLRSQYVDLKSKIDENIEKVLTHGRYVMGPEITELEEKLAKFARVKHCVSCSSGTDALLMPLMAWGLGKGDAVFTTPYTFIATAEVISLVGATPVFVDIDPTTLNIDPEKLEETIAGMQNNSKLAPGAIIPVDLFGLPANYNDITVVAEKYDIFILEDAAQSFGGAIRNKMCGSFGDAGATSFYPAKPLGCYGDGGAVFTNSSKFAEKIRSIRVHGMGTDRYDNVRIGLNARMDSIQAAILLAKLEVFEDEIKQRFEISKMYAERLAQKFTLQRIPEGYKSAWAQYSILCESEKQRDELAAKLKSDKIPTMIYYDKPLHLQPAFRRLGYKQGDFPASEDVSKRILCLPIHPYLSEGEVEKICHSLTK